MIQTLGRTARLPTTCQKHQEADIMLHIKRIG